MEFNSKVEYWVWKNSDAAPDRGHYAIDGDTHFNYNIDNIRTLIESKDLSKEEEGYFSVNVPINFAYAIFDKNFEIQSCNFDHNFELYDCKFNYRFIIIHDKFNRIFDVSWSHFNAGILFIRKNEFLSSVKLYGISSKSEIIIEECLFSDEADFSNSEFHKRVLIKNCTFKKGIKFNRVNFNNDFSFINNEVCGCLSFEDSAFK